MNAKEFEQVRSRNGRRGAGRSRRTVAAVFVFALIFALAASELVLQLTDAAPEVALISRGRFQLSDNPQLGYELKPYMEFADAGPNLAFIDFTGKSNRHGFRDRDHSFSKPPGVFRIIVLGDSITQGYGVSNPSDIFTSVVETELIHRGFNVELLNFGVSGYNTQQEIALLSETGIQYQPDAVVLAYCLNDDDGMDQGIMNALLELRGRSPDKIVVTNDPTLMKSALYRFIRFRALPLVHINRQTADTEDEVERTSSLDSNLRTLATLARNHRFQVIVTVFPALENLDDYALTAEHGQLAVLSSELGFIHLDLLAPFRACSREGSIKYSYYHPSALGHRCAGIALANCIGQRLTDWIAGR